MRRGSSLRASPSPGRRAPAIKSQNRIGLRQSAAGFPTRAGDPVAELFDSSDPKSAALWKRSYSHACLVFKLTIHTTHTPNGFKTLSARPQRSAG